MLHCVQASIAGRRDIAGGRLRSDRRTAANSSSGRCFTSLAYSADGSYLLAGGSSKWVVRGQRVVCVCALGDVVGVLCVVV
mgnify:CR=1 FL=1